jgi:hypothetical protein
MKIPVSDVITASAAVNPSYEDVKAAIENTKTCKSRAFIALTRLLWLYSLIYRGGCAVRQSTLKEAQTKPLFGDFE